MALSDTHVQKIVNALSEKLRSSLSEKEKKTIVTEHIQRVEEDSRFLIDAEFGSDWAWFNVSSPLKFSSQLKGKLVILDFFTYCCINCLHILPDLRILEERFQSEDGVVVIGVHSAKFPNEKVNANIRSAVVKYGITHPVVNDSSIDLWERLAVSCWPTLVFISPRGRLLHYIIGEGHRQELLEFTAIAREYYESTSDGLSSHSIGLSLERERSVASLHQLSFPGKIIASSGSTRQLFIADSDNHRILVVDRDTGLCVRTFGSGKAGLKDGFGKGAEFRSPQGIAHHDGVLYVADTENHCIRKVGVVYTMIHINSLLFSFLRLILPLVKCLPSLVLVTKETIKREGLKERIKRSVLLGTLCQLLLLVSR